MEIALRQVIASYGYEATHDCFLKIMKDDYSFLHKFHGNKVQKVQRDQKEVVEVVEVVPVISNIPDVQEETKPAKKPVKKKEKEVVPPVESFTETAPEAMLEDDMIDNLVVSKNQKIVVNKIGSDNKPSFITKKESDDWQKEQENTTRLRLESEGINPESLLTEENLRNWIEKEDHGYAVVAREKVGLPESVVTEVCKRYGIESAQAKRRRMIMAQKFNGKKGKK
jgi:hypothetical protein